MTPGSAQHETASFGDDRSDVAPTLVNPASGLANDYLNLFNEIVMLIEQLPVMPELMDDLLAWRPTSYEAYFAHSALPGRQAALEAFSRLDKNFRREFETIVAELDRVATGSVVSIRRHYRLRGENDHEGLARICERAGTALREVLLRAVQTVNQGNRLASESARQRKERLMRVRMKSIEDVERFRNRTYGQD